MLESLISNYCAFFRDNRMEFGWIEGIQKKKAIVVPLQGKKQFIPANRIIFNWKDKNLPMNSFLAHESIAIHLRQAENFKKFFELETMHSLLDVAKEYSMDELSEYFLDDPNNSTHKLALFISLREDTFWFRHNRNLTYTPRTHEELGLLKIQLLKKKELEKRNYNIQKWIKYLESGKLAKGYEIPYEHQDWLNKLLNLLIEGSDSKYWKDMSPILKFGSTFGISEENKLKKWLSQAGNPISASRLILLRANVKDYFNKEIYNEIERIKKNPWEKTKNLPPEIPTFTIDSEKTMDFDDAFSVLEWNKRSLKIAIHITDLSYNVHPNDRIFKEAESRISSVYSIEESFPMLPKELSNDFFSLKSDEYRNVISFFFHLSRNGEWNLLDLDSRRIKVKKNLSYKEANKLIREKKDFWYLLDKFCTKSQNNRIEKGALNIYRKEFSFDIKDRENIRITLQNRNSPANRIIEELAISVNSETGKIFQKSDYPGIYRTQSSYEIIKEVENGSTISMENIRITPAKLTTIPEKHVGLGCNFYMQVTSPIRRFSDLVMQLQLKLLIENKDPIFNEKDLLLWSENISIRQKKYKRAETDIQNYWKLKYIKQNLGYIYKVKIRKKLANGSIEVELLELDLNVPTSGLKEFKGGEQIFLKIIFVELQPPMLKVKYVDNMKENKHHILVIK